MLRTRSGSHKSAAAKRFLVSTAIIILTIIVMPGAAYAGSGTFKDGVFDFCVSVRFNATPAQLNAIKERFEQASQVMADATNGQHRFGTVIIVNNKGASSEAAFWIHPEAGRAYATDGLYGVRGQHVNMWFPSNFTGFNGSINGLDADAYTIAHEFAHQAYAVRDEYVSPQGQSAECAAPPDASDLNFCLMDNYFSRGGQFGAGVTYTLNEFCDASNHDPDQDTLQQKLHGKSCWETIASHVKFGAMAPAGSPLDTPPPPHTLTVDTNGCGDLRVMLVLDRSNSMEGGRMSYAQAGANLLVTLLENGAAVGVASFASSSSIDFPLTTVTNNTRDAAAAAINSLSTGGTTNISDGLLAGLAEITSQPQRSCKDIIVLLTDGEQTAGMPPEFVLPLLQEAKITVFTVDVGGGGSSALSNIANQTGGRSLSVTDADGLVAIFATLGMEAQDNGTTTQSPLKVSSGEVKEIPVLVEAGAANATFAVTIANDNDDIAVSLQSPSGAIINQANSGNNLKQTVTVGNTKAALNSGAYHRLFQVQAPEAGTWKIIITAGAVTTGKVEALAFSGNAGTQLNVSVEKESLTLPEPAKIYARLMFGGEAVTGATVTGIMTFPNGTKSQTPISFFDDGLDAHGDAEANDGVYSTLFSSYGGSGAYKIDVTAVNSNGMTYDGESLFSDQPSSASAVPPFTRIGSASFVTVQNREVVIRLSASPKQVAPGADITYTLPVTNFGTRSFSSVRVTGNLADEATLVSCSATGGAVCDTSDSDRPKVTFTSFEPNRTESITIVARVKDTVADETFLLTSATVVTTPTDAVSGNSTSANVQVRTVPTISTLQFDSPSYSAIEGGGSAQITVTRTGNISVPVAVNYATSNGTGKQGTDYNYAGGLLSFAAGQATKTFSVPVINNSISDGERTVNLTLSAPMSDGELGSQTTAALIISDDEPPPNLVISEFRFRGANGATDEFVELCNAGSTDVKVSTAEGSSGWALVADDGATRFVVPNGTMIPARGHFLAVNYGYSLSHYGGALRATGDLAYTGDIADNMGISLYKTANPASFTPANVLDAVGFSGVPAAFFEGTALSPIGSGLDGQYSWVRRTIITGGAPNTGRPQDTGINTNDFVFVSTTGDSFGGSAPSVLGSPGPQNSASPLQRNAQIRATLVDPLQGAGHPNNRFRDSSAVGPNAPLGTLSIRRTYTNHTGQPVTHLRFRIVDITTLNSPGYVACPDPNNCTQADLRALSSPDIQVTRIDGSSVDVRGLTLETPPAQSSGGGLNSSLLVGSITMEQPLAPGASISVQFLLGVVERGPFSFLVNVEALTGSPAGSPALQRQSNSDGTGAGKSKSNKRQQTTRVD